MNPAQQALDLLYNRVRLADVEAMTDAERRQFAEILHHWLLLSKPSA